MAALDPRIDAYIAHSAEFAQPILEHLRAVLHTSCPDLQETTKWSMPFFMYRDRILASMAAFKAHCAFGFWQHDQVIATGKNTQAMGQFGRITTVKDLPAKRELIKMIKHAMLLIDTGVKPPRAPKSGGKKPPPLSPDDLAAALARNAAARKTFAAFSPSHKREYIEWITEAKRAETRARRIAQAVIWLAQGKSRNWRYQTSRH